MPDFQDEQDQGPSAEYRQADPSTTGTVDEGAAEQGAADQGAADQGNSPKADGGDPGELSSLERCPVVGIGASAGGLEAATQFLKALPRDTGMAYVLVQHLDPNHQSILAALLAGQTAMPVRQAEQGTAVEPDHVYVIPPNTTMEIRGGVLQLSPRRGDRGRNLPIDSFFLSLAEDYRSRSVGVVLSGAATDGTLGLEAIKAAGGITFAQDATAKFDGMPRSAVAAGVVDCVLPPAGIAEEIAGLTGHPYFELRPSPPPPLDGPEFEKILVLLQSRTGVNFANYKMPTIRRRLSRRMALLHIETPGEYLEFLGKNPGEIDLLFDDLLITVTEFFRDPETFEILGEKVFAPMIKDRSSEEPIRIWVPGCSTGKEVYSLAIALLKCLEEAKKSFPIQIFGTDVSERSIETARAGRYPESISARVPAEHLKRFFMKVEGGYQITRAVRDLCVFSRQDLTRDPPLSKMDLISCRNLLIYLGPLLQKRVLSIFLYALQPAGCLLLGNTESIGSMAEYFVPLDPQHKLYCRNLALARPQIDLPPRLPLNAAIAGPDKTNDAVLVDRRADRILLDEYAPSGFLVDESFRVIKFRGEVGPYLSPPAGNPELDLFRLIREDLAHPLRAALEESRSSDRAVRKENLSIHRNDGFCAINLVVWPISEPALARHFLIVFEDAGQPDIRHFAQTAEFAGAAASQEYRELAAELSATRGYMQRLVEELRSANEEAQSSNEELQSTNEELQTAKEELQSSNEELTTTNEEMQGRNSELSQLNNDLVNLLSSMQMPIVMLNRALRIRRYTPVAEKVLHMIPADVGRPISDLKSRIDVPNLEGLVLQVINSGEPLEREVQHEGGLWFSLRIHPYKASEDRVEGAVLQLMDIHQLKTAVDEAEQARDYAEAVIETVQQPLLVLDDELRVQTANRAFFEAFRLPAGQIANRSVYELDEGRWNVPAVARLFESLSGKGEAVPQEVEIEREIGDSGSKTYLLNARHLQRSREQGLILMAIEDITERKRTAEAKYRRLFEAAPDGIVIIDVETGVITDANPFFLQLIGVERSTLIGKPFWDTEPLSYLPEGRNTLERLRRETLVRVADVPLKTVEGKRDIEVEIVANLYHEGSKQVAQFNIRDITERKQFDQQFQQTARLESLGILAGGIAHDFNNLLAGILGNAGLALGEAPPNTSYQNALKHIVHASQRASELTRQMLAYAGKGRMNFEPLDLSAMVREIGKLVESSIPKSVELKFELAPDLPLVDADAGQMQQVVMNLVINAAEAIGEGRRGQVRVSSRSEELRAEDLHARYSSAGLSAGRYVILQVEDNGSGMEEHVRSRIFEPFFTTKFTGRGLGLAAVQGIVQGHRGAIQVTSSPGKGSSFEMLLPPSDVVKSAPPPEPAASELRGTGLVLVVDDEPVVLQTAAAILKHNGYQVLTAANGELGVEAVREHQGSLAAVILDLTMPVMGGEEALKRLKQIAPSLPVILSSGYDPSQVMSSLRNLEIAAFLRKPATVSEMLITLKKAIQGAQAP